MSTPRRPFGLGDFDRGGRSPDGASRDAAVTDFLRRTYAPPTDLAYWAGLERRVMAGVRGAEVAAPEWWQPFTGWVRMGLCAAGLAAVVAGAALVQSSAAEGRAAYAAVLDASPAPVPAQAASARVRAGRRDDPQAERDLEQGAERERAREATFRFVISH
jgi:hypothetical protein